MKLFYDKKSSFKVLSPNATSLLKFMISLETSKNYLTLKECANILYTLTQSFTVWTDEHYQAFIGKLPENVSSYYMTINASQKGKVTVINRDNVNTLKNDFDFLFKLFSNMLSLMIIEGKRKLYIEE